MNLKSEFHGDQILIFSMYANHDCCDGSAESLQIRKGAADTTQNTSHSALIMRYSGIANISISSLSMT